MLVYRRRNRIATQPLHIGEVARRTGLTVDAIRFYEKERLLQPPLRTSGGFRLFRAEDIERVQFIRQVQELGFSLGEVKELLVLRSGSVDACSRVRGLLEQKLIKVRHHIRELHKLEHELKSAVLRCATAQKKTRRNRQWCPVLEPVGHRKGTQ
jgi:MerR family transcriptional regulator, copper efflux regulator